MTDSKGNRSSRTPSRVTTIKRFPSYFLSVEIELHVEEEYDIRVTLFWTISRTTRLSVYGFNVQIRGRNVVAKATDVNDVDRDNLYSSNAYHHLCLAFDACRV